MWTDTSFRTENANVYGTIRVQTKNTEKAMERKSGAKSVRDLFTYAEDNRQSLVYIATNKINGKRYIGITRQDLRRRMAHHFWCAGANHRGCTKFYRAIRKHGRQSFEFIVLSECATYKDAAREEMRLISEMKPEYNISPGGDGVAGIGQRASDETRRLFSEQRKGQPGHWLGKKRSPETIEKMRARLLAKPIDYWTGKKRSPETIAKIRKTKAERPISDKQRCAKMAWRKWVMCVNDGKVFHGTGAAAQAYGLVARSVADVCRGKSGSLRGHRFVYVDGPAPT